ncbi:MAG: NAD-dependent epimerase/dehydratase family protein [Cyanobacteria bacterium RYN_339]|nr:NAD-dependent epimerase/dehydratase family protein [Cyanobacteria bacterium RYN_339]
MKLLVLGGTRFVGYHLVEAAVARGHEVTIFHRGQSGDRPAGVEELLGDRRGDLAMLASRRWDAVLDTCGYVPAAVEATAGLRNADFYAFISSIAVYEAPAAPGTGEEAALDEHVLEDPATETVDGTNYGALKVQCERTIEQHYPNAALQVRPGIVVGPRDPTDRFTYWAARVARGGDVLVPAPAERPVQFIDARDLAAWAIRAIEDRLTGGYNVVRPHIEMGELIDALRETTGSDARPVWATELEGVEVAETFPFCLDPPDRTLLALSPAKAVAAGLTFRPLDQTIRETLAWRSDAPMKAGPASEEEARLLALQRG